MKAHIISIGDELLIGQTINTNAAWIGKKLTDIQVKVKSISVIGDEHDVILGEFKKHFKNNDILIVTGGLGPTNDDITLKCIAEFFDTELVRNESVLENIKQLFGKRGREVTKVNEDQALVPKIAKPIRNTRGTAPGIWIEKNNKIFIAMPGVPYEMKEMFEESILPALELKNKAKDYFVKIKSILTTGIPESTLYERIGDIEEFTGFTKLAFLPNQYGVKVRITILGKDENDALNKMTEVEQRLRSQVGRYIYGIDETMLEEVVGRLLVDRQLSISVAESCTGGLIASRLTDVSGSSNYFERGFVSYSNGSKVELLNVEEEFIEKYGAVSMEVARQMAEGVRATSGTDIGLASTGIMGPTGETPDKPVGLVYIGLCDENICTAKEFRFAGDRKHNKERTSQAALDMLRRHLLGIPYDE